MNTDQNELDSCEIERIASLQISVDVAALELAEQNGRAWKDCGEYEREAYRDEVRRRLGIDPR